MAADKGRVTVVMDKTDHFDKMDVLVEDKQTYEELKRDPTPALQRKILDLRHKTVKTNDKIRRFGVVMTPIIKENINDIMQITAFKAILARKINIRRCEVFKKILKIL